MKLSKRLEKLKLPERDSADISEVKQTILKDLLSLVPKKKPEKHHYVDTNGKKVFSPTRHRGYKVENQAKGHNQAIDEITKNIKEYCDE